MAKGFSSRSHGRDGKEQMLMQAVNMGLNMAAQQGYGKRRKKSKLGTALKIAQATGLMGSAASYGSPYGAQQRGYERGYDRGYAQGYAQGQARGAHYSPHVHSRPSYAHPHNSYQQNPYGAGYDPYGAHTYGTSSHDTAARVAGQVAHHLPSILRKLKKK